MPISRPAPKPRPASSSCGRAMSRKRNARWATCKSSNKSNLARASKSRPIQVRVFEKGSPSARAVFAATRMATGALPLRTCRSDVAAKCGARFRSSCDKDGAFAGADFHTRRHNRDSRSRRKFLVDHMRMNLSRIAANHLADQRVS